MAADRKVIETDVLIVGSEGAGSRAAIEIAKKGLKVLIATKGVFTKCGATVTADMDIDCPSKEVKEVFGGPGDPADTVENFAQDMFEEGKYLNNEEVVLAHCSNAAKYVKELVDWGMQINGFMHAPGHRYPRGILSTGRSMMEALRKGCKPHKIDWYQHVMITDVLTKNGRAVGGAGINIRTGEFLVVKAKAVILGTGGSMRLFPITTAPEELTGDGFYMAFQAGAEMVDMEFPLFLPCCLYWPPGALGIDYPYIFLHRVGGWWLNRFGVRFIEKWDPVRMEKGTTRDIGSISMAMEILEGRGTPHGGIWASCKHVPDEIIDQASQQPGACYGYKYGQFDLIEFGLDPRKVAFEAGPASHYWNGGIRVNAKGETGVPGLYAAGEVQGGTMGANRLSGNAVTECLVFGALTGIAAGDYAKKAAPPDIDEGQVTQVYDRIHAPLKRKDGTDVYEMRKKMQEVSFKYVGPVREEKGIAACIAEAEKMKKEVLPNIVVKNKSKIYNRELVTALENEALLLVMEVVARASSMRKESRGAMYRRDFTNTDNKEWLKNVIVKNKNGKVSLETKPVVTTSKIKLPERTKVPYMVPTWTFEKKV